MEILGVYLTPTGNQDKQIALMRKAADQWADRIRVGHLKKHETRLALQTMISKKLKYPLLALTLTSASCAHILAPIIQTGLPRARIPSTMPTVL